MNDLKRKNVCDILDSAAPDLRKALDTRFRDLKLEEPTPKDYQLLDKTIATLREGAWTNEDFERNHEKLKTDIYETSFGGRSNAEAQEDYVGESDAFERGRAVVDFTFDWLRCLIDEIVHE